MGDRAWNSTLPARKKPLKAKKDWRYNPRRPTKETNGQCQRPPKRTQIRKVSKSLARRLAEYNKLTGPYLRDHPVCMICLARGLQAARPSTEVHHLRGRNGRLLCDTRFFCASCRTCRLWPHEHPKEARELGVLAEASDWNVYPR